MDKLFCMEIECDLIPRLLWWVELLQMEKNLDVYDVATFSTPV